MSVVKAKPQIDQEFDFNGFRHGPLIQGETTTFRFWAPSARAAELLIQDRDPVAMSSAGEGFWSVKVKVPLGTRYKFRVNDNAFPDPASRQQDGDTFGWSILREAMPPSPRKTPLRPWHETLICEVHVGTVTPEGTFKALEAKLEHFRDAGYTTLEIMPLNEFPGTRNWGYDGTLIFAPDASYGTPEDLRSLVDRAHELGLCMVLDVVYNHFGEVDNFIEDYAPEFFAKDVETPWGPGINFDQPMVRQFYYENARMWLTEYDFDGLRFDSVHEIGTDSRDLFLEELAETAKDAKNHAKLIIENMANTAHLLERTAENEPKRFCAQWNDDVHHVLHHLVTGEPKYGYEDGDKDPYADLEKALADGFFRDGEAGAKSDGRTRNEPASHLPPDAFITYAQNHDQIGNRGDSRRLPDMLSAEKLDFLYFMTLLAPQLPLLFMGEEANLRTKFPYFVDLPPGPANAKRIERNEQMEKIFKEEVPPEGLPDPSDPATFAMAKLDWAHYETPEGRQALERFRELTGFRRDMLWPLTASKCLDSRSARRGNAVIVTWCFEAGEWSMAVNPQDEPVILDCRMGSAAVGSGRYTSKGDKLELGAWSAVAW